jgi:hypothetical protein
VLDSLVHVGRRAARHPDDAVAALQQELRQERAVLPGDSGDQRGFLWHESSFQFRI